MKEGSDTGVRPKIIATVTGVKGRCTAGHKVGDRLELSCEKTGGLCGWFYHDLFPRLSVMEFGGRYPWWGAEQTSFEYECSDKKNLVTLKLEIIKR